MRHSIREDAHRAEEDENEEEDKVARTRLKQRKRALSEGEDNEYVQRRDDPERYRSQATLVRRYSGATPNYPERIVPRCIGLVDQKPDHELEQSADDHCDHKELEHSTPHGLSLLKYMDLQWQ